MRTPYLKLLPSIKRLISWYMLMRAPACTIELSNSGTDPFIGISLSAYLFHLTICLWTYWEWRIDYCSAPGWSRAGCPSWASAIALFRPENERQASSKAQSRISSPTSSPDCTDSCSIWGPDGRPRTGAVGPPTLSGAYRKWTGRPWSEYRTT